MFNNSIFGSLKQTLIISRGIFPYANDMSTFSNPKILRGQRNPVAKILYLKKKRSRGDLGILETIGILETLGLNPKRVII